MVDGHRPLRLGTGLLNHSFGKSNAMYAVIKDLDSGVIPGSLKISCYSRRLNAACAAIKGLAHGVNGKKTQSRMPPNHIRRGPRYSVEGLLKSRAFGISSAVYTDIKVLDGGVILVVPAGSKHRRVSQTHML